MRKFIILSMLLCLAASCRQTEETLSKEEQARRDSLALYMAVYPTLEALPFYYAEQTGMLRQGGEDLRILHYQSMMDCDTALTGRTAQVSMSDVQRIPTLLHRDSLKTVTLRAYATPMGLYASKEKKIKTIQALKTKLVGMERHSRSAVLSMKIWEDQDIDTLDIFRIQLGSLPLRYEMMMNQLIDAAFLPQPYSLLCDSALVNCLWTDKGDTTKWNIFVTTTEVKKDARRMKQVNRLLEIYDQAAEALKNHPDTVLLHHIYRTEYGISERDLKRVHWYEWRPQSTKSKK